MFFILKAVFRSLVLPPAGPLLLAIVGACFIGRRPRWGGFLLILGLGSLWAFSTPVIADRVYHAAERYPALDLRKPTGAGAIVILGGGGQRAYAPEYRGPAADWILLERLSFGAFVARQTGLPVLLSGAPDETPVMAASLRRDFGVTPRWLDDRSRDTYENARFSARLLREAGIHRIVLVTSSPHEWRSAHEFESAGLEVVPAPAHVLAARRDDALQYLPSAGALLMSSEGVYELLGEPARRLQAALGVRERFDTHVAAAER